MLDRLPALMAYCYHGMTDFVESLTVATGFKVSSAYTGTVCWSKETSLIQSAYTST